MTSLLGRLKYVRTETADPDVGLDRKVATYNRGTGQELRHSVAARLWRPVQSKERGWDFDYEGVWQTATNRDLNPAVANGLSDEQ